MMTLWQGLCHLPTSWHPPMGRLLGKFLLIFAKDRKKIAQANISLCLPNLSEDDLKRNINEIQKFTDNSVNKIDKILEAKKIDILKV